MDSVDAIFLYTLASNLNIMSERAITHEQLQRIGLQDNGHEDSLLSSKTVGLDSIASELKSIRRLVAREAKANQCLVTHCYESWQIPESTS